MGKKRVVVAMSGGVDSSVALALLKEQGYDCIGVSMQLWDYSKKEDERGSSSGSCCSLDDIYDARGVADRLGAPFYVMNMEEVFSKEVVDYFVDSYLNGATPNPCIKCNQILKFEALLKKAVGLEADFLATGHYARIIESDGDYKLLKGVDSEKDQSYFLFTMTEGQLRKVLFPLGGLTKKEVRSIARKYGLKTSDKRESQEICFVEEPSYTDFLSARLPSKAGDIIDTGGKVLGRHNGLFNYTIGQRKGLSLSGGPFYVLDIDTGSNRLVVGPLEKLFSNGLIAGEINWIDKDASKAASSGGLKNVTVKIRYRHTGAEAELTAADNGKIEVRFNEPQKAVTPGQAAVFYRGEEVLGGRWIEKAVK
ncbi:MAG: tRNA 2-thiouridine(34) synthase MnmA [Deltaproteobacteria bacterium]|nr:tRNA 2-thiouridine(34) synthase MnmA [Deltaproteobacteria bacterium]